MTPSLFLISISAFKPQVSLQILDASPTNSGKTRRAARLPVCGPLLVLGDNERSHLWGVASLRHVELEGVEPSSKQGNNTLSTRLFQPWIFELWQDLDHKPQPYPLKFHHGGEAHHDYSRFNRTAWPKSFGTTAFERCLVPSPGDGIKPVIYCTSIRQRERNCFRQINFWPPRLRSRQSALRVLTYHSNPLSNPVSPDLFFLLEEWNGLQS